MDLLTEADRAVIVPFLEARENGGPKTPDWSNATLAAAYRRYVRALANFSAKDIGTSGKMPQAVSDSITEALRARRAALALKAVETDGVIQ